MFKKTSFEETSDASFILKTSSEVSFTYEYL